MAQANNMTIGHERSRSSQQHHHLPAATHHSYAPQYATNAQHMYQQASRAQPTHSNTHGQPVYGSNDSRAQAQAQNQNAWSQGLYGAYQQGQHSGGMLPSTHMMGGYR